MWGREKEGGDSERNDLTREREQERKGERDKKWKDKERERRRENVGERERGGDRVLPFRVRYQNWILDIDLISCFGKKSFVLG